MEYIKIINLIHTTVKFDGKIIRPDAVYAFEDSRGAIYDGYYPPKIDFYIDKHLSYPNASEPMEGEWVIEDRNIFNAFYKDLQMDPDIQVDFVTMTVNDKFED